MQAVLSQRWETQIHTTPFQLYRALRVINPSPYMYYLRVAGVELVGSSPETLVRCEDGHISLRPIAGTRRRGRTAEEDQELGRRLLADEKERAEHVMLVDLGRNDVGRVAARGSVKVESLMQVERYSHVMHIVSQVTGELEKGKSVYDVMRACFPAGTVSGAPKIRAMEIIEELEPTRRGPYAGRSRLLWIFRQYGSVHQHPYRRHQGTTGLYPGRRRHRRRFDILNMNMKRPAIRRGP